MALPIGAFNPGIAVTAPGGVFTYAHNKSRPQFYAGDFTIDTGYDDPVSFTNGVEAAEIYGARVYPSAAAISYNPGAVFTGDWHIDAVPVWSKGFTYGVGPTLRQRVLIRCKVFLASPVNYNVNNSWQRLDQVEWSLYRV